MIGFLSSILLLEIFYFFYQYIRMTLNNPIIYKYEHR